MGIHVFFLFPETSGKTLEDIEEMFLVGTPAWKTKSAFYSSRRVEGGEADAEKKLEMSGVGASERVEKADVGTKA